MIRHRSTKSSQLVRIPLITRFTAENLRKSFKERKFCLNRAIPTILLILISILFQELVRLNLTNLKRMPSFNISKKWSPSSWIGKNFLK
jgi:hypothetical protein